MNRQQALVVLATINKISRQIHTLLSTDDLSDIMITIPDVLNIKRYVTDLEKFFKASSCESLVANIDHIIETDDLWEYLGTTRMEDKESLALLNEYANAVDKLKSYSLAYKQMLKEEKRKLLVDELCSDKALKVLQRAVDAALLTPDYQPDRFLTRQQIKVLAFAMAKAIGLPKRGQYAIFSSQWNLEDKKIKIQGIVLAESKKDELEIIKSVFPEVDYTELYKTTDTALFHVDCDDDKILQLFMSLLIHGYIDASTTYTDFRKIFGRGDLKERKKVNWVTTIRKLCYFLYLAFDNSQVFIWQKARNCFLVNGKIPNQGTMKSGVYLLPNGKEGLSDSYDPVLYSIAKLFAKEIDSPAKQAENQKW